MKLIDDWKAVLLKAWSVRLMFIAGALDILERALPYMGSIEELVPPGVFGAFSIVVLIAAAGARVLTQKGLSDVAATETKSQ
jgi:xanthine/uracil permease